MMKDLIEISEKTFIDCKRFVNDELELGISDEKLKEILLSNLSLFGSLMDWGIDDTESKGMLIDRISNEFLNRNWPTHGDKINIDEFTEDLKKKISEESK